MFLVALIALAAGVAVVVPASAGRDGGKVVSHPHRKHGHHHRPTTTAPPTTAEETDGSSPASTEAPTTSSAPITQAPTTTRATTTTVARPPSTESELGRFRVECDFSHRAQVDPIVNPGPPGTPSAHMHDFFGNVSTGAESTYESMIAAETTCGFSPDTAGYWVPALLNENHEFIEPDRMLVYYRNRPISYGSTTTFPKDFRMIGGGVYPHAYWTCDGQSDGALESRAPSPPDCGGRDIKLQVFFPSCWDGVRIDSPNHRDHVAYAYDESDGTSTDISDDTCPPTHPVKIPQLHLRVVYPAQDGAYHLSDHADIAHADFWNTWDQEELEKAVKDCVAAEDNCEELED